MKDNLLDGFNSDLLNWYGKEKINVDDETYLIIFRLKDNNKLKKDDILDIKEYFNLDAVFKNKDGSYFLFCKKIEDVNIIYEQ